MTPAAVVRLQGRAHDAVARALRLGILARPSLCAACGGKRGRIEAHHHDGYSREAWLRVTWLCTSCHRRAHAETRPDTATMQAGASR